MTISFTWLFDLLKKVIDLSNYLFSLVTYEFTVGRFEILGVTVFKGLTFSLWQAVFGLGGGFILILLGLRFLKMFAPGA